MSKTTYKQKPTPIGDKTENGEMRNFELWMVVAAERDVTAHFKPSNEIQQVKNYLQTETHDNRRTFLRTKRQTDRQTNTHLQIRRAGYGPTGS